LSKLLSPVAEPAVAFPFRPTKVSLLSYKSFSSGLQMFFFCLTFYVAGAATYVPRPATYVPRPATCVAGAAT
jgi:hypothetical protein